MQAKVGLSERRACQIVGADRKMIRYKSRRPPDTALRTRLRDLANERRRFGYRRLFILLRREGEPSSINRIYRVYRDEGLTVRKRRARRKAIGTRAPILVEARANARWSLDFVHDQFGCGRRFRILNVVDDVTRECLAAIPDTSISGRRVTRELTTLIERRGKPGMIVSDNGTELTSNAIDTVTTLSEATDVNVLHELKDALDQVGVYEWQEVEDFVTRYFAGEDAQTLSPIIDIAANRFNAELFASDPAFKAARARTSNKFSTRTWTTDPALKAIGRNCRAIIFPRSFVNRRAIIFTNC